MADDTKKIYGIKNEQIIDYKSICTKYILMLNLQMNYKLNLEMLEKLLIGYKEIHSIFYPEYIGDNIKIQQEEFEYLDIVSIDLINILNNKVPDLRKFKIIELLEENMKRNYYVRTKKVLKLS